MEPVLAAIARAIADSAGRTADGQAIDLPISTADFLQLFHGTDLLTANWISENGADQARMLEYYAQAEAFCTTRCLRTARQYATLNNAVMLEGAVPAILGVKVPTTVVRELLATSLVREVVEDKALEFLPPSFAVINATMTDRTVTLAADVRFDV